MEWVADESRHDGQAIISASRTLRTHEDPASAVTPVIRRISAADLRDVLARVAQRRSFHVRVSLTRLLATALRVGIQARGEMSTRGISLTLGTMEWQTEIKACGVVGLLSPRRPPPRHRSVRLS